jgi:kynureninase
MAAEFDPAPGADAWVISNPPVLAMAPLLASLQVFADAGFERLRQKSIALTGWTATAIEQHLHDEIEIITPAQVERRGCQLSLRVRAGRETGRELFEFLEQSGVVPDWREPDVIRIAPVPLYNRFEDGARLIELMLGFFRRNQTGNS